MATRAQQCGDAFVQWADNTLAAGNLPFLRTVKPHVAALIPLADLADPATGPGAAELSFGARSAWHRLWQPQLVVRRPSSAALDRRRRDVAGELGSVVRTPPCVLEYESRD